MRKLLLGCGVVSTVWYAAMTALVPLAWPGYDWRSRVVSELSAIDAPTRALWLPLGVIYALLVAAFGAGVWQAAGKRRALRIAAIALLVGAAFDLAWPPMHLREALAAGQGSLTDTLHIAFTAVWGVIGMVVMLCAALALGWWFRIYTIASVAIMIVFGILTSQSAPLVSTNLPTPWIGLWERINMAAFMIWLAVLAVVLLREQRRPAPITGAAAMGAQHALRA